MPRRRNRSRDCRRNRSRRLARQHEDWSHTSNSAARVIVNRASRLIGLAPPPVPPKRNAPRGRSRLAGLRVSSAISSEEVDDESSDFRTQSSCPLGRGHPFPGPGMIRRGTLDPGPSICIHVVLVQFIKDEQECVSKAGTAERASTRCNSNLRKDLANVSTLAAQRFCAYV